MKPISLFLLLGIVALACSTEKSPTAAQPIPKPDLSTPDRAVQSFWVAVHFKDTLSEAEDTTVFVRHFFSGKLYRTLLDVGKAQKEKARKSRIEDRYSIEKVTIESDSRAIVLALQDKSHDRYTMVKRDPTG
jgi:hypothetical protein